VRYFSVAGRMKAVNIWHPFWLPKMVLDGWEEKRRETERKHWEKSVEGSSREIKTKVPHWACDSEWGNDGLVAVQSAKWGEFLGIMEGCDHWQLRGARGIEFGVDLPALPGIGLGGPSNGNHSTKKGNNDGWGFLEWTKFVGAWRREEKKFQDEAMRSSSPSPALAIGSSPNGELVSSTPSRSVTSSTGPRSPSLRDLSSLSSSSSLSPPSIQRSSVEVKEHGDDDPVVRSSTDNLSAVFDWLMELPIAEATTNLNKDVERVGRSTTARGDSDSASRKRKINELASKEDLERFYIALSRKLYDEGL